MINAVQKRPWPEIISDVDLLQAIAAGDSGALGALYDRYGRLIYSLAWTIIRDDAAAEEITQDVFLQVWHKAGTYQPDLGKVTTWLVRVARNRAIDLLRRKNIRPEASQVSLEEFEFTESEDAVEVEREAEQNFARWRVLDALAQIPEEQRQVLLLAYLKGYSHQQIADLTGEALGTVKTRIRLAMQKLRQLLPEDA